MKKIIIIFLAVSILFTIIFIIPHQGSNYENAIKYAIEGSRFVYDLNVDEENKIIDYYVTGLHDTINVVVRYNEYSLNNFELDFTDGFEINIHFINNLNDEIYMTYSNCMPDVGPLHNNIDVVYIENMTFIHFDKSEKSKYSQINYLVGLDENNYYKLCNYFSGIKVAYCIYTTDDKEYNTLISKVGELVPNCIVQPLF